MRIERKEYRGGSRYPDKNSDIRVGQSVSEKEDAARRRGSGNGQRSGRGPKKDWHTVYVLVIVFLLLAAVCLGGILFLYRSRGSAFDGVTVDLSSLKSPYAVLMDEDTANVIGEKKSEEKIYPASMTKILTVLVAIESIPDLDKMVTMSEDFYDSLYEEDASRAGFEPGEEATVRDLLYGALLPSGAECCLQLAIEAAGSEEAFVELMNQKAEELGLTQTNFVNCTGLHDAEEYTTAHEMALILRAALENDTFRTVFTTHYYTVPASSVHPDGFTFWSTLFKSTESETVTGGEILGGKTGFTEEAGHCLASMAKIGDREYILVTAGWAADDETGTYHISDAFTAYNLLGTALGYGEQ